MVDLLSSGPAAPSTASTSRPASARSPLSPLPRAAASPNNGVVGWLQLPYNHPDFGNDYDARETKLANDAVKAADPFVDYQAFDTNKNGVLSPTELHVVVIAAGYETSFGGEGANCRPERVGSRGRPTPAGRQGRWRQGQP